MRMDFQDYHVGLTVNLKKSIAKSGQSSFRKIVRFSFGHSERSSRCHKSRQNIILSCSTCSKKWSNSLKNSELAPYFSKQSDISVSNECLFWNSRAVISVSLRDKVIKDLHSVHLGIQRMKSIARQYCYWPKIDSGIEICAEQCSLCITTAKVPSKAHFKLWIRLHADFAEAKKGLYFLILVNFYSKSSEVFRVNSTTATATIQASDKTFVGFGLPETLITDDSPSFKLQEFQTFCLQNGIQQLLSPSYHPAK